MFLPFETYPVSRRVVMVFPLYPITTPRWLPLKVVNVYPLYSCATICVDRGVHASGEFRCSESSWFLICLDSSAIYYAVYIIFSLATARYLWFMHS